MTKAVGAWLMQRYLSWQMEQGTKQTISDFALFLTVSRDTLNNWLTGRRTPRGKSVTLLAEKLGPEIYDLLGLARPDVDAGLIYVSHLWDRLTPEQRQQLMKDAERYASQSRPNPSAAEPNSS